MRVGNPGLVAFVAITDHGSFQRAAEAVRSGTVEFGVAVTTLPESSIAVAPASLVSVPPKGIRLGRALGVISPRGVPLPETAAEGPEAVEREMLAKFRAHVALSSERGARPRGRAPRD